MYAVLVMSIQTNSDKQRFDQLCQSLTRLTRELDQLIEPSLAEEAVIKGSVYELKRKCGKPTCKCADGQLHARMVVSASEKGKTRLRVIPRGSLVDVETKVRRYQELRKARMRIVAVQREMLQVVDEMEAMRREPVPTAETSVKARGK